MIKHKNIILSVMVAGLGLIALSGVSKTYAQTDTKYPLLVQRLIEKFNLNTDEVDTVIKDVKNQRQEEIKQTISGRLDQAVQGGKITADQKAKILTKLDEWQNKKAELINLTLEERKTKMQELRTELEAWAEENNIDTGVLFGFDHKMFMKGFHKGYMMGHMY